MNRMRWESQREPDPERFARMFTDVETQASAHSALDDLADAQALAVAEIARTTWADRLRAMTSAQVELPDGTVISGHVEAVLADGLHLRDAMQEWIIFSQAVQSLRGLGERVTPASRIEQRLSLMSVLRCWLDDGSPVQCLSVRGPREGMIVRVGADHLDLDEQDRDDLSQARRRWTLPIARLWAVRR